MGLFDWLFGKKRDAVPRWARSFDQREYAFWVELVRKDLQRRGLTVLLGDGTVEVRVEGGDTHSFDLKDLAQRCHKLAAEAWPDEVRRHFDGVLSAEEWARRALDAARSFDAVRGRLKVNVYGRELPPVPKSQLFTWDISDGLVGCLVYDLPNTTRSVSVEDARTWGRPRQELISLAIKNACSEPVREEAIEVQTGCKVRIIGGGFFTSSNALNLERRVSVEHPWGALVCVPNRHTVLYHPIIDIKVVVAVNTMLMLGHKLFTDGPGSISPELFWWRGGRLERLPSRFGDQNVRFGPPDEFVRMLKQLAQPN